MCSPDCQNPHRISRLLICWYSLSRFTIIFFSALRLSSSFSLSTHLFYFLSIFRIFLIYKRRCACVSFCCWERRRDDRYYFLSFCGWSVDDIYFLIAPLFSKYSLGSVFLLGRLPSLISNHNRLCSLCMNPFFIFLSLRPAFLLATVDKNKILLLFIINTIDPFLLSRRVYKIFTLHSYLIPPFFWLTWKIICSTYSNWF